jgi:hypothetical protein
VKGGASWTETKRLAPEASNVDGGVAVTVVNRAALAAYPLADCQTFVAFRAVDAQTGRAGLGREFLVISVGAGANKTPFCLRQGEVAVIALNRSYLDGKSWLERQKVLRNGADTAQSRGSTTRRQQSPG